MDDKIAQRKNVYFDLPYLLFVKDSMDDPELKAWIKAVEEGITPLPYSPHAPNSEHLDMLVLGGDSPVYLPPEPLADFYRVSFPPHFQVGIQTLRRINVKRRTIIAFEVPGDRTGRATFSSVKVMFQMDQFRPEYHHDAHLFVRLAIEAINKFVANYRVISDRPYVQPVTAQTILDFWVQTVFKDGTSHTLSLGTGGGIARGLGGAIPDEQDAELREAVLSNRLPAIFKILDADVRDHLDLQNWRLAVIESAVLFEAWVTNFIRQKLIGASVSADEIEAKFMTERGPASITRIAKTLVREVTRFEFSQTEQYLKWEKNVRDLRNDLVHGKRFDVSPEEAHEAYHTTTEAIGLLGRL